MRAKKLVQTIIGSAGFVLEDITVNPEMNEINIAVRPTEHERCRCEICHHIGSAVRQGARTPALAHPGHRRKQVYIEVDEPRGTLPETWRGDSIGSLGTAQQPFHQKF